MNPTHIETSLRDLLIIVFKRKWCLLAIFLVTIFSAFFYLFILREEVYQATAKVLVKLGQEQAVPTTVLGERPNIIANRHQDVNSELDILRSDQLLEQVVDRLGLHKPSPAPPRPSSFFAAVRHDTKQAVKSVKTWFKELLITAGIREKHSPRDAARWMLAQGLLVEPQVTSNVIVANLSYPTREGASHILNTILDLYLDFRLKIFQDASAVNFFKEQKKQSSDELTRTQNELHEFERAHHITNFAEQKSVLLRQISQVTASLRVAKIELDRSTIKATRIEQELSKTDPDFAVIGEFIPNSFPAQLQHELATLQRQREELRMVEMDHGVRIRNNRDQFMALMKLAATHLQSVLAEKQQAYDTLNATLQESEQALRALHNSEMKWQSLVREAKISEQDYLFKQDKLLEASAVEALERQKVGNVTVIQHAMNPLMPQGVSKTMLLAVALVFGVLAAGSWAAVAEFFDHGVYSPEALERYLQVPVTIVVPVHRGVSCEASTVENDELILESAARVEDTRSDH